MCLPLLKYLCILSPLLAIWMKQVVWLLLFCLFFKKTQKKKHKKTPKKKKKKKKKKEESTNHCSIHLFFKPADKWPLTQVANLRGQRAKEKGETFKMEPHHHRD